MPLVQDDSLGQQAQPEVEALAKVEIGDKWGFIASRPRWTSTVRLCRPQRRALQQLSAFANGGTMPAELQTAAMDLDFSGSGEGENTLRSNSRSKSTDFSTLTRGGKSRQVIERIGGASRARTDDLIVANSRIRVARSEAG